MKQIIIFLISALVFAACSSSPMTESPNEGYLDWSTITLKASTEVTSPTRAVPADLQIDIYKAGESTPFRTFAPGESSRRLSLPEGEYRLLAYTLNHDTEYTNNELGAPKYEAATTFTIEAAKVTKVALSVPMTNVAITFTLPEGIETTLPTHSFIVQNSDASRSLVLQDGETGYFDCATTGTATLLYTLTMTNQDGEVFNRLGTLSAAQAGTQYSIDYRLETLKLK